MRLFNGPQRRVNAAARKFAASLSGSFSLDPHARIDVQGRSTPALRNGEIFGLPGGVLRTGWK